MQQDAQCTYGKYREMQDIFALYFVELSSRNALTQRESLCPHRQGQPPTAKKAAKAASLRAENSAPGSSEQRWYPTRSSAAPRR
jgi:hypothetical protein